MQPFAQMQSTNEDFYHLYNADYQLRVGNSNEARNSLGDISFDSPYIKEKRQLMSELVRTEQEKQNINAIKQLADNVCFDPDDYYIFGMNPIGHDSHVSIVDKHGRFSPSNYTLVESHILLRRCIENLLDSFRC